MNTIEKQVNASTKIKSTLKENGIIFYERKLSSGCALILPYQWSIYNLKFQVNLIIDNKQNICKMGFNCIKNRDKENIAEQLLDMNSKLELGSLSIKENSNEISYYFSFSVPVSFTYEDYMNYLHFCFRVFYDLYYSNIIDNSLYLYKDNGEDNE